MTGFLDLSAELRNNVYSLVTQEVRTIAFKNDQMSLYCGQNLVATTGLIAANKQINNEYYAVLLNRAFDSNTTIKTVVTDFDFRHLAKSIKEHTEHNPNCLQALSQDPTRPKVLIKLQLNMLRAEDATTLGKWFHFRRSWNIAVKYQINGVRGGKAQLHATKLNAICLAFAWNEWADEWPPIRDALTYWRDGNFECMEIVGKAPVDQFFYVTAGGEEVAEDVGVTERAERRSNDLDYGLILREYVDGEFEKMKPFDGVGYDDKDLA